MMRNDPDKLVVRGREQLARGRFNKALDAFRTATKTAPHHVEAWLGRAEAASHVGAVNEAVDALFRVVDTYTRTGRAGDALALCLRILELDPDHQAGLRFRRLLERRTEPEPAPRPATATAPAAAPAPEPAAAAAAAPATATEPEPAPAPATAPATEPEPEPEPAHDARPPGRATLIPTAARQAAASLGNPRPVAPPELPRRPPHSPAPNDELPTIPRPPTPPPVQLHSPRPPRPPTPPPPVRTGKPNALPRPSTPPPAPPRLPPPTAQTVVVPAPPPKGVSQPIDVLKAVIDVMASSPLLAELDSDLVKRLVEVGRAIQRPAGSDVFHQDDRGNSLYLVLHGQVAVVKDSPAGPTELARLGPGAFFGEMAVITDQPRTATVRATTNSTVLEVSRTAVDELVALEPRMLDLLMRFFRARLVATLLATSPMFAGLSLDDQRGLVASMSLRELDPDSAVLHEGGATQGLFVLLAGELTVALADGRVLATLHAGAVFGEMSLLEDAPVMATVRAAGRAWVVQLPPDGFHDLVRRHPSVRERLVALARARHAANLRNLSS